MATHSYVGPAESDKDEVRFQIQDIGPTQWQYSDEELQYLIDKYGKGQAVLEAIKGLMIRYAKLKDQKVDKVEVDYSQLYNQYKTLWEDLRKDKARTAIPFLGGISRTDKVQTRCGVDNVGAFPSINDDDPEGLTCTANTYNSGIDPIDGNGGCY